MDRDTSEIGKLTERIAKDPRSKLFVPLAEEYKKIGDIEMSIHVLTEGLKNNPGYVTARSFLGRLLIDKGDLGGAQKEFEEVVRAIPDNLLGQKKLGDIYALQGRAKDALVCYRVVITLNPKDQETLGLIADLEAGRDITGKISRPKGPQTAAQAPQPEQQKPSPAPARQAAPSAAPGPALRSKPAVSPPVSPPVPEQEVAEEVLIVEPLEAEPVSALQEPVAERFDFLSEGKIDAGEGPIPGLEVSVPGGFFEDAPVLAPELEGPAEREKEVVPEGEEPAIALTDEEAPPAATKKKKSDDFTTDTLAELYISQGFYEKAIDIYDRMLAENPGHQGLRDKLARLHALAEAAGGGTAGAEKSEEESAFALEQGNAPDLGGAADTLGGEEMTFVPPAAGVPEETLPVDTAFDIGEPFGQTPFPGGEQEAKEYVPPAQEEQEEPPPFSGGFDLSEKAFSPSREEDENEEDRLPPPAGGGGRPLPVLSEAEPVEYTPPVEYAPDLPEQSPAASSSMEPAARTVKDARKETISRLELWLKTIAKEK